MKLQDLHRKKIDTLFTTINNDRELTRQIQSILQWHQLLKKVDGKYGRITNYMLRRFQQIHNIRESTLGEKTIKGLIEIHPNTTRELLNSTRINFEQKMLLACQEQNFLIFRHPNKINILYIKGMNPDFTLNADTPNQFNDLCLIFDFVDNRPRLLGKWRATATPGRYYTDNSHSLGALHHNGQATAWTVGKHRNYEALVQSEKIDITRDANRDFLTDGDKTYSGWYGANCHGSNTTNMRDIARWSAGCKVVLSMKAHWEYMRLVKSDCDYLRKNNYVFTVGVIEGTDLLKEINEPQTVSAEIKALTAVIFGVAKGKSTEFKTAVGYTVLNRYNISRQTKHDDWWGNTVEEICYKPQQYNYRLNYYEDEAKEYQESAAIAQQVILRSLPDKTKGATNFTRERAPYWTQGMKKTAAIAGHSFYL